MKTFVFCLSTLLVLSMNALAQKKDPASPVARKIEAYYRALKNQEIEFPADNIHNDNLFKKYPLLQNLMKALKKRWFHLESGSEKQAQKIFDEYYDKWRNKISEFKAGGTIEEYDIVSKIGIVELQPIIRRITTNELNAQVALTIKEIKPTMDTIDKKITILTNNYHRDLENERKNYHHLDSCYKELQERKIQTSDKCQKQSVIDNKKITDLYEENSNLNRKINTLKDSISALNDTINNLKSIIENSVKEYYSNRVKELKEKVKELENKNKELKELLNKCEKQQKGTAYVAVDFETFKNSLFQLIPFFYKVDPYYNLFFNNSSEIIEGNNSVSITSITEELNKKPFSKLILLGYSFDNINNTNSIKIINEAKTFFSDRIIKSGIQPERINSMYMGMFHFNPNNLYSFIKVDESRIPKYRILALIID
jgi:hypothetical protein